MEKERKKVLGGKVKSWERVLLLAGCGKRGASGGAPNSTPVVSWKQLGNVNGNGNVNVNGKGGASKDAIIKDSSFVSFSLAYASQISARKLAAALWEFQHYFGTASMYLGGSSNRRQLHHRDEGKEHVQHRDHTLAADHDQPASAGSLRRHIAASLMRHQSARKNHLTMQPLSPTSYGSSLEMAQYNPGATSDSSLELKGRLRGRGESSYGFKTSTELLKVLNRIWTLEEQHASNMSLVKALKTELDHARAKIKDLLRDQQANRRQIDDLMKQISEDNLVKKTKEDQQEDRLFDAALGSMRVELEEERKLRKRSETLHRKLARELFEVKVALSTTSKELEREKKSRELLEELCDEFAKGVREYAQKLGHGDSLVHISESWLDERAQGGPCAENLGQEIEAFLMPRKKKVVSKGDLKETRVIRRRSLESIPEVATPTTSKVGPSGTHEEEQEQEELTLSRRRTGQGQTPPSVQMSDIQSSTPQEEEPDVKMKKISQGTASSAADVSMLQKSDIYDSIEGAHQRPRGFNKEDDRMMRELLVSEGKEVSSSKQGLLRMRNVSPVRQWVTSMRSPDPRVSESSSSRPARDNTLKAKLQEPKTKGPRARLKILKGSS